MRHPLAVPALFALAIIVVALPGAEPTSLVTWFRALAALALFGWFPGWALARSLRLERLDGFAAAFSPILSTGLLVLTAINRVPVRKAAWVPVIVTGVLMVVAVLRGRRPAGAGSHAAADTGAHGGSDAAADAGAPDRPTLLLQPHVLRFALAVVALLVFINLVNPWLRWRADGRFHIGVTAEMLRGGIPPTDPFFAGLSLQYMWFFHSWLAGLAALSGAATSWLMVGTNMLGLVAFLTLAAVLARDLGRSKAGVWITVLVTGFGMGGLSWALLPVKLVGVFTGAKRGMEELAGLFALWPPTIQKELGFLSAGYDQPFLLRKFLVGTAMSLALAALLLQLVLVLRRLRGGSAALLPLIAVASTGAIILHPMVGIPVVAVGIAAALAAPLLPHVEKRLGRLAPTSAEAPVSWGRALSVVIASIAGVAMAMPYMKLVTAGKQAEAGLPIDFFAMKVICLVIGSLGLSIPALIGLIGWWGSRRRESRTNGHPAETWLAIWATLLAGFALFVKFPLERANIDKPTLLVHLAAALTAGGVLGAWWDRGSPEAHRRIITYLALLIIPTHVILLTTYALESDPRTYRPHEKDAHAWLRTNTPPTAIVFDSLDRDRPGVEIPRRMYWSHDQFAVTHQYPVEEMNRRRAVRDGLYATPSNDSTDAAQSIRWARAKAIDELRAISGEVLVLVRAGEARPGATGEPFGTGPVTGSFAAGDTDPLDRDENFDRVFNTDDTRVYRLVKSSR